MLPGRLRVWMCSKGVPVLMYPEGLRGLRVRMLLAAGLLELKVRVRRLTELRV
jgi:hypothetical protein